MNWADITITDWILIGGFLMIALGFSHLGRSLDGIWAKLEEIRKGVAPDELDD